MSFSEFRFASWLGAIVILVGCTQSLPQTYQAQGTVSFPDGSPVRSGYVEFAPTSPGTSARGTLDRNGAFSLETFGAKDGALPGDYTVLVLQHSRPISPETARKLGAAHAEHADSAKLVALKYSRRNTSDLKCTIEKTNQNFFELVVEPQ